MSGCTLLFGPPGTGKTTASLDYVAKAIERGIPLERIAYLSFTRAAIQEARLRLGAKNPTDAPFFRTVHSMGHKLCGLKREQVVQAFHLHELGQQIGEQFRAGEEWARHVERQRASGEFEAEPTGEAYNPIWQGAPAHLTCVGDIALHLHGLARAKHLPPEIMWRDWVDVTNPDVVAWPRVQAVINAYTAYKDSNDLFDFADMLDMAQGQLPVDLVVIDEAQDCTSAQWRMLNRVVPPEAELVLAGDDDQSIFSWSGADPTALARQTGDRIVLPTSHRLPKAVYDLAQRVVQRIVQRVPKQYAPRDAEGEVRNIDMVEKLDLTQGTWLCLARTTKQLAAFVTLARQQGIVYGTAGVGEGGVWWSWDTPSVKAAQTMVALQRGGEVTRSALKRLAPFVDQSLRSCIVHATRTLPDPVRWDHVFADHEGLRSVDWWEALPHLSPRDVTYVRELRRHNEPLHGGGRVRILTVHGAKGLEADHVALQTGLPQRVVRGQREDADAELRVQYVGATRARETLTLVRTLHRDHWQF